MSSSSNIYNQTANTNELNSFRKAVASNNKQSIEKHISHMKNLSENELSIALFICIQNFRLEDQSDQCLFLLLRNKANPNYQINGQTPLIAACKIGQLTMVKNLIENGALPDRCNPQGKHPLQFILCARKENYDVAEYLISVISSVNIEIDKTHPLIITVQKEFARIFKMLVDKGATLTYNNQQTILHIIMKKKFKDLRKKKKFIKELANRSQLSQCKDKFGKLPIQYETQDQIKTYFLQIFKPKQKIIVQKQPHHSRIKEKQSISKQVSKEKEPKKKGKQQEPSSAVQEQVDEEQNYEQGYNHHINQEEDKQRIIEVFQEDQQEKKIQQEKQKTKKLLGKILTPTAIVSNKKTHKITVKSSFVQKSIVVQKPIIQKQVEKEKVKKVNTNDNNKKTKTQINKKNKSFVTSKKSQIQDQKKEQQPSKKKHIVRSSSYRQQQLKKITTKKPMAEIKAENIKLQKKIEEQIDTVENEKQKTILSAEDQQIIQKLIQELTQRIEQVINLEKISEDKSQQSGEIMDESQDQQQSQQGIEPLINIQEQLSPDILSFATFQHTKYTQRQPLVQQVMRYLQNKMKLCIQSHVNRQFTFKVALYGSQATGMAISESDVDLMIISSLSIKQLMYIFEFHQIFEQQQIVEFKFLKNATIPVIKLAFGPTYHSIKVDITVMFGNHRGLRCVELMQEFKLAEPLLLPLVLTLKRLIYAYNLSDPYTGGLSSYSLTLMTIALLQMTSTEKSHANIGKIFLQFLFFYGFQLDYVCQAIIIQPPYHTQQNSYGYQYFYNIYQLPNTLDLSSKLVIYDPLDPVNNVGRSTYRIECLKNMLRVSYIRIKLQNLTIQSLLAPQFMQLIQENY